MILTTILEAAARSTALAAAAWLGLRLLRVQNLRAERLVWMAVLCGSLLMPLAMQRRTVTIALPDPVAQADLAPVPRATAITRVHEVLPQGTFVSMAPAPAQRKPVERAGASLSWPLLFTVLYAGLAGVLLLRLAVGLVLASRLWRRASAVEWTVGEGFDQRAPIRKSARVKGPVTVAQGILLPEEAASWTAAKFEAVVRHEQCHATQHDFVWGVMAKLHAAIFWFNPLAWWLERKLSEVSEALADEAALERGTSADTYAGVLFEVASGSRPVTWGVAMARSANVGKRVSRILSSVRPPTSLTLRQRVTVSTLAIALIAGTAGVAFRLDAQPPLPPTPPEAPAPAVAPEPPAPGEPGEPPPAPAPPPSRALASSAAPALAPPAPEPPPAPPGAPAPPAPTKLRWEITGEGDGWEIVTLVPSEGIESGVIGGVEGGIPGGIEAGITGSIDGRTRGTVALSRLPQRPGQSVIVFERNGVSYVVDDPVLVARAKRLQPMLGSEALLSANLEALKELEPAKQSGELTSALEAQMAAKKELEAAQQESRLSSEQIAKRVEELKSRLASLNSELSQMRRDWTAQDLEHVQRQLAELQSTLGRYGEGLTASKAEAMARDISNAQALQSAEVLKRNAAALRQAMSLEEAQQKGIGADDEKMRKLLDEALKNGKARRR